MTRPPDARSRATPTGRPTLKLSTSAIAGKIAMQVTGINVHPIQRLLVHMPERAFAQLVADAQNSFDLRPYFAPIRVASWKL